MPSTFAIVNFLQKKEVEVVPLTWVSPEGCVWPPLKAEDARRLVKRLCKPSEEWLCHEAKVMGEYPTYDMARSYLRKAEIESDLASDAEDRGRGKRKKFSHFPSSSSVEDSELTFTETTGLVAPIYKKRKSQSAEGTNLSFAESTGISVPMMVEEASVRDAFPDALLQDVIVHQVAPHSVPAATQSEDILTAFRNLTREVLIVKENQKIIIKNQEIILDKLCTTDNFAPIAETFGDGDVLPVKLPVKNIEEIQHLESALLKPELFNYLINFTSNCGGVTVDSTVKRIMKKLLTDDVAQEFSWMGAKGKAVFYKLQLRRVIFEATRRNETVKNAATDAAVENAIKNWLRHAKARHTRVAREYSSNSPSLLCK